MSNIRSKFGTTYQKYPQLPEMRKLWHSGYWDGPLSGMCLIEGKKYWFECIEEWLDNNSYPEDDDDFEAPWYRRFLIWKLTDEQQKELEASHLKFQMMVGTHCDYDENGKRGSYNSGVTGESTKLYFEESKLRKKKLNITPNEDQILGWYEWS